jgi:hypothetical protein
MLDTLYFLSMLGGIAWLAWWATAGAASPRPAPFDMREPARAAPPAAKPGAASAEGWRGRRG